LPSDHQGLATSAIIYIPTKEGFTYLVAIVDRHSRKIIAWQISRRIDSRLVIEAIEKAVTLRGPVPGVIVHSDRRSKCTCEAFDDRLSKHRLVQSMSRRGNCFDDA